MEQEDSFIDHIRQQLQDNELPYKEGAWEQYVRYARRKKIHTLRNWTAAAAVIVLLLGSGFFFLNKFGSNLRNEAQQMVKSTTPNQVLPKENQDSAISTSQANAVIAANNSIHPAADQSKKLVAIGEKNSFYLQNTSPSTAMGATSSSLESNINSSSLEKKPKEDLSGKNNNAINNQSVTENTASQKTTYNDDLERIMAENQTAKQKLSKKWNVGVVFAPGTGNSGKLNLGYGMSVAYRLSNKFSLASGLAYTELSGGRNVNDPGAALTNFSGRQLESMEANVAGISVPLELQFHFNSKIYAGAGVSAMAVVSNKSQNNYATNQIMSSDFVAKNGNVLKAESVSSPTATPAIAQPATNQTFVGFYNFSLGYRQKLGKKKTIGIEPFFNIPMNNHLSTENIRLSDMGLRIRIGL